MNTCMHYKCMFLVRSKSTARMRGVGRATDAHVHHAGVKIEKIVLHNSNDWNYRTPKCLSSPALLQEVGDLSCSSSFD